MHNLPKQHQAPRVRAPRVSVPNKEQATVALAGEQYVGVLCKLSATGGSIRLNSPFTPGTLADIKFKTTAGNLIAAIEFLNMACGIPHAQAFRFLHMDLADRRRLDGVLQQIRKQGFGEKRSWRYQPLVQFAQRTFSAAKDKLAGS